MSNEKTIQELKPSLKNYLIPLIFGLATAIFLIGIPILVWIWLDMWSSQYKVTNKRVVVRRGIISKHIDEVELRDIRSTNLRQGIIQRILNVGDIYIGSSGHEGLEVEIKGVNCPEKLKELIRNQREQTAIAG